MKRIQLFEFEDYPWFPSWLRGCMTRLMMVMHRFIGSKEDLAQLVQEALVHSKRPAIIDLCSGSGGAILSTFKMLKEKEGNDNLTLTLTDLYPNKELADSINSGKDAGVTYLTTSIDATNVGSSFTGVRTMTGSLHHMKPAVARKILKDAKDSRQPICVYEISDNSAPIALWWISLPLIFIMTFFITPFVRPLTWKQLVFTYVIPVIPFFFAWDGAVSNARTYTISDMDELLKGLESDQYTWKKGVLGNKVKKLYLLGLPVNEKR